MLNQHSETSPSSAYVRYAASALLTALGDSPAVLIHGPRQCGKTTLARAVGELIGFQYVTFDDEGVLSAAREDPVGFVSRLPDHTILDEVQRIPELFTSLKLVIDERRTSGRFILTGSANIFLVPMMADSLAGRVEVLSLHPLAQAEIEERSPEFVTDLLGNRFQTTVGQRRHSDLVTRIVAGGYPAALARPAASRRTAWYRDYVDTQIQRDIRALSQLRSFDGVPNLLRIIAANTASLINVAELAAPFEVTRQTIHDHVSLLERVFLVDRLQAWHSKELQRAVKRPKLHMGDTGVACALLGVDETTLHGRRDLHGAMLESFAIQEIRKLASWHEDPIRFSHYRDRDDFEVDLVLESGHTRVAGVEVKAASSVNAGDFRGLRKFRDALGNRFKCGVVLYDGAIVSRFDENLWAVPLDRLWTGERAIPA